MWDIFAVWKEYEKITMHFNDLLIKLRTQALGGVAALATVVTIFAKLNISNTKESWEVAALVFGGLALFWIAIWLLDFQYYNRLLTGAVVALVDIEKQSTQSSQTNTIQMSTTIENMVSGSHPPYPGRSHCERFQLGFGRWAFYVIVFITLIIGFGFSIWMHAISG